MNLVQYLIENINNYDNIIIRGPYLIKYLLYLLKINKINNFDFNKIIYIQMNKSIEYEYIDKFKNIIHMSFLEYFNNKQASLKL